MPFTLAHAAASLPFRRAQVVPSALIVGTFAPDFEYFLRLAPSGGFGHSIPGVFILTLPLALLILWLFHSFVKIASVRLLPDTIQERLAAKVKPFQWRGGGRLFAIVGSLLLGIATHIVWDSFTHPTSWLYRHWSFLRQTLHLPLVGSIPYYKVFQHGSTFLGMAALSMWFAVWYRNTKRSPFALKQPLTAVRRNITLSLLVTVALIGSAVRIAASVESPTHGLTLESLTGQTVCAFIGILWWELVAYGWYDSSPQPSLKSMKK